MIGRASSLAALDAVSGAHPVMLRDDSQHNRWVNSRALELIGIDDGTRDPQDGQILRDAETGAATGLLLERASGSAEQAVERSIPDLAERNKASCRRAAEILTGFGITAWPRSIVRTSSMAGASPRCPGNGRCRAPISSATR